MKHYRLLYVNDQISWMCTRTAAANQSERNDLWQVCVKSQTWNTCMNKWKKVGEKNTEILLHKILCIQYNYQFY